MLEPVNLIDDLEHAMTVLSAPTSYTHELGTTRFTSLATPSRGTVETSIWRVEIAPGTPGTPHEVSREVEVPRRCRRARARIGESTHDATAGTRSSPPHTSFEIANESDAPPKSSAANRLAVRR